MRTIAFFLCIGMALWSISFSMDSSSLFAWFWYAVALIWIWNGVTILSRGKAV